MESLIIDTDNLVTLTGLYDQSAAAYLNSATVQLTLLDRNRAEVAGTVWPVTMNYVSGSDGNYQGTVPDTTTLEAGRRYTAKVVADGGAGKLRTWEIAAVAVRG